MCGIFGAFGASAGSARDVRDVISRTLRHRGPNDEGFNEGSGWALGFRRLSILDLSPLGHQPMKTPDARHWLVFNGEIYNYVELRRELEQAGERFAGASDTEVLLRLLARDGVSALPKLNGMFALAYLNASTRQFVIARDRLGKKPVYLRTTGGNLRFASELKGLLAWPGAARDVDHAALVEYLALSYLPSEQCIFEGYWKLRPAHYLAGSLDDPDKAVTRPYWQLELNDDPTERGLTASEEEELIALLADATAVRLRSDVPVGVFLSGGIDSGIVAALAARQSARKPLALTVAFDEAAHDETTLATLTAQRAQLPQRIVHQAAGGLSMIDDLAWQFDEPFADPSALPTYSLCKAASEHAIVFLSGDGGDESFGGYRRYIETPRYRSATGFLRPIRRLAAAATRLLPPLSPARYRLVKATLPDEQYAAAFDALPADPVLATVAGNAVRDHLRGAGASLWSRWNRSRGASLLNRQQALDFSHYLPDDILVKMDRASMAHSIEVRSPFLDVRLVEWAARLPRGVMLNEREGKLPLRRLASRLLPDEVARGHKRGFGVPLDDWFRQAPGTRFATERLLSREALARGWWTARGVKRVLDAHRGGRGRDFGVTIWKLLMLDAWARSYLAPLPISSRQPLRHPVDAAIA